MWARRAWAAGCLTFGVMWTSLAAAQPEPRADEPVPDEAPPDEAPPDEASPDEASPDEASPEEGAEPAPEPTEEPPMTELPEEPPPDIQPLEVDFDTNMDVANIAPNAGVQVQISSSGMSSGDGEYLPIVRVAPIYPSRALSRGIEGYVDLEFTVTTAGTVKDPVVIETTSSLFNRAAVRAVLKFKYKPRVVDGQPVEVPGVKTRIRFELED